MSISRRSGGLQLVVRSLADSLSETHCRIEVFAGADRNTAADLADWQDLHVTTVSQYGPSFFGYMPALRSAIRNADLDVLHTHGLWMYPSVAALGLYRSTKKPLMVSPHGMLDPWALKNSAWKKRLAGLCYENAHLRAAACLHALCPSEYESIRAHGLRNPVAIIPNGVDLPGIDQVSGIPNWGDRIPTDAKVLLFLSRIHPKKGLTNLLGAFAKVKKELPSAAKRWHLIIAGWEHGEHEKELRRLTTTLELSDSVHFVGAQFDEQKSTSFARADAFILPSFSEGLPMAVLEAWSCQLPVLMTPECNLPDGFLARAAIEMDADAASISMALTELFCTNEFELLSMGNRGRKLVEERFTWPAVAASMHSVYAWLLGHAARPDCVITD